MDLSSIVKTIASPIHRGVAIEAICPICAEPQIFEAPDNYSSCRDNLRSKACPLNDCVTRDRAVAAVSFSLFDREEVKTLAIHEAAPGGRGLSLWLNAKNLVFSGYYPDKPSGEMVGHIRNENLEQQSSPTRPLTLWIAEDAVDHRVALISVITFALFRATHDGWRSPPNPSTLWRRSRPSSSMSAT
jgi:hypothetical protein